MELCAINYSYEDTESERSVLLQRSFCNFISTGASRCSALGLVPRGEPLINTHPPRFRLPFPTLSFFGNVALPLSPPTLGLHK